jgi:hypothetical protein
MSPARRVSAIKVAGAFLCVLLPAVLGAAEQARGPAPRGVVVSAGATPPAEPGGETLLELGARGR